jgi:hypothetical protein
MRQPGSGAARVLKLRASFCFPEISLRRKYPGSRSS